MHTEIKKNKRCYSGNKAQDPQTVINWKLVKRLIKEGKLTAMKFGNAWLINLDEFYGFFKKGDNE